MKANKARGSMLRRKDSQSFALLIGLLVLGCNSKERRRNDSGVATLAEPNWARLSAEACVEYVAAVEDCGAAVADSQPYGPLDDDCQGYGYGSLLCSVEVLRETECASSISAAELEALLRQCIEVYDEKDEIP
jgi:hypothetical protein